MRWMMGSWIMFVKYMVRRWFGCMESESWYCSLMMWTMLVKGIVNLRRNWRSQWRMGVEVWNMM